MIEGKQFLALRYRKVRTQRADPGVAGQAEERDAQGNVIRPAVEAVPPTPEVWEEQLHKVYIEERAEVIATNLSGELAEQFDYYEIVIPERGSGDCSLARVQLKAERKPAPAKEIAEVEVGGEVVGAAEVDASA